MLMYRQIVTEIVMSVVITLGLYYIVIHVNMRKNTNERHNRITIWIFTSIP